MFRRLRKNRRGQLHLDYIIAAALFILVVAGVALSTFQALSPFYSAAKADQLGMVSDSIAQTLLSSSGNPLDWGNELSLPEDFQLGLVEHDPVEYPNTGGVGFYSLDPNKLSRLSSSDPYFIPYSSYYSGFSEEIPDFESFYKIPSENNSLSSLGLSNFGFKLRIRPPYQFVVNVEKSGSSLLFNIESSTWDGVPISGVQYSLAVIGSESSQLLSGTTNEAGADTASIGIDSQGVYVIMGISETEMGLRSFSFTSLNVSVIDPMFKVVSYTQRSSTYGSKVVAYVWNTSQTPILIDSEKQSQWNVYIKAAVLQPNGSVLGPSSMTYDSGGFWTYDYSSPLSGPYLSCILAFNNESAVALFGWDHVSYPMMPDYGPTDIPYEDTVKLTRYVVVRGTVYQALLYCWDPEAEAPKTVLSASCLGIGIIAACPITYFVSKRAYKRELPETEN